MKKTQLFVAILSGLCAVSVSGVREYKFVRRMMVWSDARSYCRETYTDLATVYSRDDNDELQSLLQRMGTHQAWIGLYDNVTKWKWLLDNQVFYNGVDYSHWRGSEPNNVKSKEKCVAVTMNGFWRDHECSLESPSVCYNETRPKKYVLVKTPMSFRAAKRHCRSLYRELASIRNQSENDIIAKLATKRTWIGLHRSMWKHWSNWTPANFTNWGMDQPDNGGSTMESCAMVKTSTGKWFDEDCQKKYHFVCEKINPMQRLRLKLKFRSEVDMNDPAVKQQILEQIHAKLRNGTSKIKTSWVDKSGKVFHKEQKRTQGGEFPFKI